jgi:5-methylcytosine-specific restriction protein A
MPTKARRACSVCRQSLAADERHGHEPQRKPAPASARYSWAERKRRAETVAAWVLVHGWVCPGYGVPPHPASDLTADHLIPRSLGGEHGPLGVACAGCNARRGNGLRGAL